MRIETALVVICTIALFGCGRTPAGSSAPQAAAATSPAQAATPAGAGGLMSTPHRTPGLWETTMTMSGANLPGAAGAMPAMKMQACVDQASEARSGIVNTSVRGGEENCNRSFQPQLDGSWKFNSTCQLHSGGVITVSGVVHGDMSSAYQMEADTTVMGASNPRMDHAMHMSLQARRIGDCQPGQHGGDMMIGGMRIPAGAGRPQ